ncbi:MAG: NUDIX hydrolase [Candidatus Doudnabacteria bacterium]|nr:NUDIX hydrolase [Candidatus Doudnabacteria bacterium]
MIFDVPPEDYNPGFEAVGCFMEHNGDILLLKRNDDDTEGGRWGIPGGKVDLGETLAQGLAREILEETGIVIPPEDLLHFKALSLRTHRDFVCHMFSFKFTDMGKPLVRINPREHTKFVWAPPRQALDLELVTHKEDCIRLFYGVVKEPFSQ